jgi:hypothetical protein
MTATGMVTPNAPEWQGMSSERRQAIIDGAAALTVHRQGLDRIFQIGHAFEELQLEAMFRSHSNNPIGKRYNEQYALLEKPAPELARVNKTDRNQYIWCWQQRAALENWWATKAQNQRDRWTHPDAVKRHYLAEHGDGNNQERPKVPSAAARKDETIRQLQEELDAAQAEIRRLKRRDNVSEGRDWSWQNEPEDIAAAMLRLYPDKAKRLGSALQNLAKARARTR